MRIDVQLTAGLRDVPEEARRHEQRGLSGIWSTETDRDPFLPVALAAEHTQSVTIGTSIAVAFARSPMTTAYSAWDLQRLASGRFVLGLGSQVRAHVERRFSMPFDRPAARMAEYIAALHAIWDTWRTGTPLEFEGEFYSHTLMTPFFSPEPLPCERPAVHLAAVGEAMTTVAGQVADGVLLHSFTTERYVREASLPALQRAATVAGREDACSVTVLATVATGQTSEEVDAAIDAVRQQIAFYGSTPAYRGVLELHGWGELATELHDLSTSGSPDRWERMRDAVDDTVLDEFAVIGDPEAVARGLVDRFGGLADRLQVYMPYEAPAATRERLTEELVALT